MTRLTSNDLSRKKPLVAAGLRARGGPGRLRRRYPAASDPAVAQHAVQCGPTPTDLVDMKYNMVWDGIFHAVTWTMCVIGIGLLFRAGGRADVRWSGSIFAGSLISGWGLFNFVEGLIDHQLLGIHHVHPGAGQLAWDLGFVVLGGLGMMLAGYTLARGKHKRERIGRASVLHHPTVA